MEQLFWTSALAAAYVYAGYPLLLAAWARIAGQPVRKQPYPAGSWPSISIVIAARNEAARLPARLTNLLRIDYPGQREVIVVSDGSTDGTAGAMTPFDNDVRFFEIPSAGKPAALNTAVAAARGEILVFADARQTFCDAALEELIANFADPDVGGATGELVIDCETGAVASTMGDGVGLYWTYEKWMRRKEAAIWSTLGATGAVYALRRGLWRPLPLETLLDDVLAPMRVVLDGKRIVFDEKVIAYDRTSPDAATEARRKTRTLAGNYQILGQEPRLLLPLVNPVWLQYMSHKVGRLVVPWTLAAAFVSSAALAADNAFYLTAFLLQAAFYALAAVVGVQARGILGRLSRVAYAFVVMNYSAVAGLFAVVNGRHVWK
jgi:cellulose synthase/poly-beta-1,6-N-acetylglucosamine synthase-like glycosyltransferase